MQMIGISFWIPTIVELTIAVAQPTGFLFGKLIILHINVSFIGPIVAGSNLKKGTTQQQI